MIRIAAFAIVVAFLLTGWLDFHWAKVDEAARKELAARRPPPEVFKAPPVWPSDAHYDPQRKLSIPLRCPSAWIITQADGGRSRLYCTGSADASGR